MRHYSPLDESTSAALQISSMLLSSSPRIHLTHCDGMFVADQHNAAGEALLKKNYFRLDTKRKAYVMNNAIAAGRLRDYADEKAKKEINRKLISVEPWVGPLRTPKGLNEKPYQEPVIRWMLSRNRSLVYADPGTGKAVMAAITAATLAASTEEHWRFVFLTPPHLVENIKEEFARWAPDLYIEVCRETPPFFNVVEKTVLIVPDSQLIDDRTLVAIISNLFPSTCQTMLFVDEAHRYKHPGSGRTFELFGTEDFKTSGVVDFFDRVSYLTGTPLENGRPIELFPMLNKSAGEVIGYMNRFHFGRRYCHAHKKPDGYGWDFSGESNLEELSKKMRQKFMISLSKKELNLPPRTTEFIFVCDDMPAKVAEMDRALLRLVSPEDLMAGKLAATYKLKDDEELHTATYRKLLGIAKVPFAVDLLRYCMTETEENVIAFAWHKEVIAQLAERLKRFDPLVIDGSVSKKKRNERVKKFQDKNGTNRLILVNTEAGGTGYTMTKANRVLHIEPHWVPGKNDQASDRADRIGRDHELLIQYMVYKNSMDKRVMETNFSKNKKIAKL